MTRQLLLALLVAATAASSLAAQAPTPQPTVGRDLLAVAYLRLEYALRDRPPAADRMADLNRAADRAGLAFLGGRTAFAAQLMDSLAAALERDTAEASAHLGEARRVLESAPLRRRLLVAGSDTLPYRVHAPSGASGRLPLVVALHGAMADENIFMEGYGAGRIRRLADERGFIVATPFTNAAMRSPQLLMALVDTLAATLPVDIARVVIIGHSLGGIAAWRIAAAFPERIAGVVCVSAPCGGVPADTLSRRMPPTLVFVGDLDPMVSPARAEQGAAAARAAGLSVDLRTTPGYGHTLIVGEVLPDALTFLLEQRRPATTPR